MFNGLTSTTTPAYAIYDYRNVTSATSNGVITLALTDDCPPVIYILTGSSVAMQIHFLLVTQIMYTQ